ncbi:MAG TPA: UTP--glucose-1-phosphate uridylyltransferase [Candidatus Dormibacteraeota bacterium]
MSSSVRKAVIPVGGLGTRFLPVTRAVPKEMLPLLDKPSIQWGLEECVASGIEQVVVVIDPGKYAIPDYFRRDRELELYLEERGKHDLLEVVRAVDRLTHEVEMVYVPQLEPLGLGHAVWTARHLIGDEPCAVLLPDDVIVAEPPCLRQLIDAHAEAGGTVIASRAVPRSQLSRYGVFEIESGPGPLHKVTDVVEKPSAEDAPSDLAIFGRYVLAPEVLDALGGTQPGAGKEIQLTDAIRATISTSRVSALEFTGDLHDLGTIPGYLKANLALGLRHPDLREELLSLVRELAGERVTKE